MELRNINRIGIVLLALMVAGLIFVSKCQSQAHNLNSLQFVKEYKVIKINSSFCLNPDGRIKEIFSSPSSYQQLFDNDYCYEVLSIKNFIACYTFTSNGTSIDFNAGYLADCDSVSLNIVYSFECKLINPVVVGTITGLTIGRNYTWCINLECIGKGTGFTSFCPYFQNVSMKLINPK